MTGKLHIIYTASFDFSLLICFGDMCVLCATVAAWETFNIIMLAIAIDSQKRFNRNHHTTSNPFSESQRVTLPLSVEYETISGYLHIVHSNSSNHPYGTKLYVVCIIALQSSSHDDDDDDGWGCIVACASCAHDDNDGGGALLVFAGAQKTKRQRNSSQRLYAMCSMFWPMAFCLIVISAEAAKRKHFQFCSYRYVAHEIWRQYRTLDVFVWFGRIVRGQFIRLEYWNSLNCTIRRIWYFSHWTLRKLQEQVK